MKCAKDSKVAGLNFTSDIWNHEINSPFKNVNSAIRESIQHSHPSYRETLMCIFTDASDNNWGILHTQVPKAHLARPVLEQDHQPVVIPSGSFVGSQRRWILTEKEAFPIFEATEHIRHFVLSTQNLKLLTHHRILGYVFNPSANANDLNKNAAEKLFRWPMKLYASRFTIQDLPGEANTWADILSRWDIPPRQID